ncbi:MAG: alpha/beta hydrolase-fold protein [Gaiellaceae bacterium]
MSARTAVLVVVAIAASGIAGSAPASARFAIPSFTWIETGPAGGTIWQGVIQNSAYPRDRRESLVYLPPGISWGNAYPTIYLLHGFRGSPYSFLDGLRFAFYADRAIADRLVQPFLAVMPVAGLTPRYQGEWTGPWENFVVDDVVPWADEHLPTSPLAQDRAIAGLSAGGYGAVDIGLRHTDLFGTIEAWSGYFDAPRDGRLRHASVSNLAAHDPTVLVEREAKLLRRLGTRFFLSCGAQDRGSLGDSVRFARLLSRLGLSHRAYFIPGVHSNWFWQAQLTSALRYAFPSA